MLAGSGLLKGDSHPNYQFGILHVLFPRGLVVRYDRLQIVVEKKSKPQRSLEAFGAWYGMFPFVRVCRSGKDSSTVGTQELMQGPVHLNGPRGRNFVIVHYQSVNVHCVMPLYLFRRKKGIDTVNGSRVGRGGTRLMVQVHPLLPTFILVLIPESISEELASILQSELLGRPSIDVADKGIQTGRDTDAGSRHEDNTWLEGTKQVNKYFIGDNVA